MSTETLWWVLSRRCNLACAYCASPDTPILRADGRWQPLGSLKVGDALWSFAERSSPGRHRPMLRGSVRATHRKRGEALRIVHEAGEVILGSRHHLLDSSGRWTHADELQPGRRLRLLAQPLASPPETDAYRLGYFSGISEGDGTIGSYARTGLSAGRWPYHTKQWAYRLAMNDEAALLRTETYAATLGVALTRCTHKHARGTMPALRARARAIVEKVAVLLKPRDEDAEWLRGWLAGMFDAEGSYSHGGALRISQCDVSRRDRLAAGLVRLGFGVVVEPKGVRLTGGVAEILRFFATVCPALDRKLALEAVAPRHSRPRVLAVEKLGSRDLADITVAGAPTYYAAGVPSHNCYQGYDHSAELVERRGLRQFMPAEVLERALPWAVSWTRKELGITLYGGEPLLAWPLVQEHLPRWKEAFAAADWQETDRNGNVVRGKKSARFSCTTNGTLLSEQVRAFFDEHQVGILLSLDGPARVHDQLRTYVNGRPSWESIHALDLLAWRPDLEIAWLLDPGRDWGVPDLDWMIERGFRHINFNLQWLERWPAEAQLRLQRFMEAVYARCARGELRSNMPGKLTKSLVGEREDQPCGTGRQMVALTPEGWLYPSQEMAFTVFEPGRAQGTPEHYRIGDVFKSPVIDVERLADVSQIRNDQMKPPAGYECATCVAKASCFGGCHCRYVGGDGINVANRFDVTVGLCESTVASVTGLLRGAAVAKLVAPVPAKSEQAARRPLPIAGWGK